ncbi:hypothetical protein V5G65_13350 [Mammaliicoccus sciuri]|uniref:hypothetical protein n=1 Tax=Mammaliicoccus sciuri TaxID=1296 RepID=UPI003799E009
MGVSSILIGASLVFGINSNEVDAKSEYLFKINSKEESVEESKEPTPEEASVETSVNYKIQN